MSMPIYTTLTVARMLRMVRTAAPASALCSFVSNWRLLCMRMLTARSRISLVVSRMSYLLSSKMRWWTMNAAVRKVMVMWPAIWKLGQSKAKTVSTMKELRLVKNIT